MTTQALSNKPSLELATEYLAAPQPVFTSRKSYQEDYTFLASPSPLAAKSLPIPLQPSTSGYDVSMKQHERAMVERLQGRGRQGSATSDRLSWAPLSPGAEPAVVLGDDEPHKVSPFKNPNAGHLSLTTPKTAVNAREYGSKGHSIVDETKSMLLSGGPASQAGNLETAAERRLSVSTIFASKLSIQSPVAAIQPDVLQVFGHVYFGDPAKADVFVAPSALRRESLGDQTEDVGRGQLTVRARVRPKDKDRKPFVLTRSFDLVQLRTTMPATLTTPSTSRRPSEALLSPAALSSPVNPPALGSDRRRASVAASGHRVGHRLAKTNSKELPVHLAYARAYLPALAALMLSGHVKTGDSIDVPMPHPAVWPQTLAYVYMSSGEPSDAVKQNVLHLGGRI
ncbi:hypothetical protein BD289DRAFT_482293 [Coniella lustricola]|uniref:Uncharacterized protein n=1 Tax=Coniella lustricola TaxID=2025994 RepID=A0A2T3A9I5_9PEZI|nr:hypothetical protein BD289DRAFT_482293 [Coniella lustricola]